MVFCSNNFSMDSFSSRESGQKFFPSGITGEDCSSRSLANSFQVRLVAFLFAIFMDVGVLIGFDSGSS